MRRSGVQGLPYRYDLTIHVTVRGDGQHADGDGATATANRIHEVLLREFGDDPRVEAIWTESIRSRPENLS